MQQTATIDDRISLKRFSYCGIKTGSLSSCSCLLDRQIVYRKTNLAKERHVQARALASSLISESTETLAQYRMLSLGHCKACRQHVGLARASRAGLESSWRKALADLDSNRVFHTLPLSDIFAAAPGSAFISCRTRPAGVEKACSCRNSVGIALGISILRSRHLAFYLVNAAET